MKRNIAFTVGLIAVALGLITVPEGLMRASEQFLGHALLLVSPAWATETTTYTYDALGRLTQSSHSGSINNGQQTTYTHDAAGNRTNTTTTGAANPNP